MALRCLLPSVWKPVGRTLPLLVKLPLLSTLQQLRLLQLPLLLWVLRWWRRLLLLVLQRLLLLLVLPLRRLLLLLVLRQLLLRVLQLLLVISALLLLPVSLLLPAAPCSTTILAATPPPAPLLLPGRSALLPLPLPRLLAALLLLQQVCFPCPPCLWRQLIPEALQQLMLRLVLWGQLGTCGVKLLVVNTHLQ